MTQLNARWESQQAAKDGPLKPYLLLALPNGPKISSGGSLSPRGDWRAPSDGGAGAWLAELEANVPASDGA